jgi:hypothetical protein
MQVRLLPSRLERLTLVEGGTPVSSDKACLAVRHALCGSGRATQSSAKHNRTTGNNVDNNW